MPKPHNELTNQNQVKKYETTKDRNYRQARGSTNNERRSPSTTRSVRYQTNQSTISGACSASPESQVLKTSWRQEERRNHQAVSSTYRAEFKHVASFNIFCQWYCQHEFVIINNFLETAWHNILFVVIDVFFVEIEKCFIA